MYARLLSLEDYKISLKSGWGSTEIIALSTSEDLQKVELDIISNTQCNSLLSDDKLDQGIIDSQMCAAVLTGRKDTCGGGELIRDRPENT